MYRVASARNRYSGTARRSRKSSNRYLRMAQRMRQDGIGAVDGPITPPLRGSRRSRAARLMADAVGGQPTPGPPPPAHPYRRRGSALSSVCRVSEPFISPHRLACGLRRLPLKGGVIPIGMFEAEARPPRRLPAVAAPNQPREDGHEDSSYPISNTDTDIHAIPLPVCLTPLASQICRTPQPSPLVATTS